MGKHNVLADALSLPNRILGSKVEAVAGGLQGSVQEVAGVNRSSCNISIHRCSIYCSLYNDHNGSILASEVVVSGYSRSGGRRSGRSSTVQGPSASASLPSVPPGSVQAVASCLETIIGFTRAGGFSTHVAQQVSLARCPSSRAGYQSSGLFFDNDIGQRVIRFLVPLCPR